MRGARPGGRLGEEPPARRRTTRTRCTARRCRSTSARLAGRVRAAAPAHAVRAERGRRGGGRLGRARVRRPVRIAAAALRSHLAGSVLGEHTPLSGLAGDAVPTPTEMAARAAYEQRRPRRRATSTSPRCRTPMPRARSSPSRSSGSARAAAAARWVRDGGGTMRSRCRSTRAAGCSRRASRSAHRRWARWSSSPGSSAARPAPRQVDGARVALAHTVGRGANACVTILQR